MTSSLRTSELLSEFLDDMDPDAPAGSQGRKMMETKLRWYVHKWQRRQNERKLESKGKVPGANPPTTSEAAGSAKPAASAVDDDEISAALKKKDQVRQAQAANRRRMRGGASMATPARSVSSTTSVAQTNEADDAERLAAL